MNGGAGIDTVTYADATSAVAVTLANQGQTGGGRSDVVKNFENVTGSAFNDAMTGDSGDNIISGGGGDDTLAGAGGDDTVQGGIGNDVMSGGSGNDVMAGGGGNDIMAGGIGTNNFTFEAPSDGVNIATNNAVTIGGVWDNQIADFTSGTDKITLADSAIVLG